MPAILPNNVIDMRILNQIYSEKFAAWLDRDFEKLRASRDFLKRPYGYLKVIENLERTDEIAIREIVIHEKRIANHQINVTFNQVFECSDSLMSWS